MESKDTELMAPSVCIGKYTHLSSKGKQVSDEAAHFLGRWLITWSREEMQNSWHNAHTVGQHGPFDRVDAWQHVEEQGAQSDCMEGLRQKRL